MARQKSGGGRKGTFGDQRLPVAKDYPTNRSRRLLVLLAAAAVVVVAGAISWDRIAGGSSLVSGGPLSSSHAVFADDCGHCHDPRARAATDARCSVCHEKFGDQLGVFTFAAHYVYRSDDFRRVVPSEHEVPCAECHGEHRGRHAQITRLANETCQSCHFGSLGGRHPEFRFAAEGLADSSALRFPHVHHVREVMKRQRLEDPERACLYCHNARSDGRAFEPLSFDRHCDTCHLTATMATPGLPVAGGSADGVGVATLESLAASGGPGLRWVYFSNPGEFRLRGDQVVKTPIHHRDPWVLENLRRLRRRLYPEGGLADLLRASADAEPHQVRELYREALASLEEQAQGLRNRPEPEIQRQLARITELIETLARRIEEPFAALDETRFLLALDRRDPALPEAEVAEIETLVSDLTEACRRCHEVENATIVRVDEQQQQLRRAEFDHRAHIVQRRCLDCHDAIPVLRHLEAGDKPAPELDHAGIQNLPTIDTCRGCHNPRQASDRCVTCHQFHPDKSRRAQMLPYLSSDGEEAP